MARKFLYGSLGAIFGLIAGVVTLNAVFSTLSTPNTGPNYVYICCALVFAAAGSYAGVKFADLLNSRYGNTPLGKDPNRNMIEAFYVIVYGFWPAMMGCLAIIVLILLGGRIPLALAIIYAIATIAFGLRYKHYESLVTDLPSTWWLKQSQYITSLKIVMSTMILGSVVAIIIYTLQSLGSH